MRLQPQSQLGENATTTARNLESTYRPLTKARSLTQTRDDPPRALLLSVGVAGNPGRPDVCALPLPEMVIDSDGVPHVPHLLLNDELPSPVPPEMPIVGYGLEAELPEGWVEN